MKFRIAAISGMLLAVPASAQSPGTVNLIGPSSTPGAPKITEVGTVNAIINQALSSKFDYGPVAGVPVGGAFVTPTGGTQQTLNNALGGSALKTNNLSDLTDALTARSNLGLGSIATQSAGAVSITGGAISNANASAANVTPTGSTVRTLANGLAGPFTLTGAGTSGQYDGQISVTGGGPLPGQGTLQMGSALAFFIGPDASPNLAILPNPGATEYWQMSGNPTGFGALQLATNGTSVGDVDGYFAAQHQGTMTFGNGSGIALQILDPGGPSGAYFQIQPPNHASLGPSASTITAALMATGDIAIVPATANDRIGRVVPDGTTAGGNTRGQFSFDFQSQNGRTAATQIASGSAACLVGGAANTAAGGQSCVVGGFGNAITGGFSFAGAGNQAADDGRRATQVFSSGPFTTPGDNQRAQQVFNGISTASGSVRLTTSTQTAGAANCLNLVTGKTAAFDVIIAGVDVTATGHRIGWFNHVLLGKETTGVMSIDQGTPVALGPNTATVSLTVDSTNSCLNATVTADNADTWHWHMTTTASEVK